MVHEIKTDEEFRQCINDSSYRATIVDFYATWCPPCRSIKPVFEELASKNSELQFLKVNVDNIPNVTEDAGILSMPTFIVYIRGVKKISMEGANREGLERLVEAAYNYNEEINESKDSDSKTKPSFVAPKHRPEEERRKRSCCTIS